MKTTLHPWLRSLAVATFAACLAGCGGVDADKSLASGRAYLAKGELRSAVIELKTALQKKPDSPEARFLLGKALLESDDPFAAAVELRKAIDLKYPQGEISPLFARALLLQGKNKEVVAQFAEMRLDDAARQAGLRTTVGLAYSSLGKGSDAIAAFKQAIELAPNYVPALNGMARQLAINGEREAALRAISDIVAAGKADPDTLVMQGDLLALVSKDKDGAIAAYRKALSLDKSHFAAHASIVQWLIASGDVKAAAAQVGELVKVRPGHAATRFLQAQVAHLQGDNKTAKELVLQLLKGAPDNPSLNQLAGSIELAAGSGVAAQVYLNKALQVTPQSASARRMLAGAHLKSGEVEKALQLLQPLLADSSTDAVALVLAGEAHMQSGDLEKASEMFTHAVKVNPSNAANLTALARTRFLKGDAEGALADLQQIAATDHGVVADLELITSQMRRREFHGAMKAIDAMERKQPDKPMSAQLRGAAYLGLHDAINARASFERALALDPNYFPAAFNLAALDVSDKKPLVAQQRFEAILKTQPGHLRALLALADLRARTGASRADVTSLLATAVRLNGGDINAHIALINYHLANQQPDAALAAAQQADAAFPGQPSILDALGRAQLSAGQSNQALATFNKALTLQPGNLPALLRIADIKAAENDIEAAITSLKRAIAVAPDALLPVQRLITIEVQRGHFPDALKAARAVQKRKPAHSLGYVLEGDTLRAQKSEAAALAIYKMALSKLAPEAAAPRVHGLLVSMGKGAEADRFSVSWLKEHPNDVSFAVYLGDAALARKDFAGAEAAYRRVLDASPDQVVALNNIAWILAKSQRPGALPLAERANVLQPNQPALMDTLALALASERRVGEAIEVQKKAVALAPSAPALRLALARLHVQAGHKTEARELLEPLSQLGDKFSDQGEVMSLLTSL